MAARRKPNGQYRKRTTQRRRTSKYKKAIDIPNAAIGLVSANALTTVLMGTDLRTFLFEGWDGHMNNKADNSWEIVLAEVLNFGKIKNMGMSSSYSLSKAMTHNIKSNWAKAAGAVFLAQMTNNIAKKAGVYRMLNKTVRTAGAGQMVKF